MKKISKVILSLFLLASFNVSSVCAQEKEDNIIYIEGIEDWTDLAKRSEYDAFSKDIKVVLENDLEFNDNFIPLSYFQGEFDGQNHLLKGISLTKEEEFSGIIRITGTDANIKNLNVIFDYDSKSECVGFVGYNQGKIENVNITFLGNGNDELGGLVGYNSSTGVIDTCTIRGEVYGSHYVGGIVGTNYGVVKNCYNYANVNNKVNDDTLDIKSLTLDSIVKSEKVASITDIGGVAGKNYGTIKNCVNYGTIGYEHVGYNVGGIVGTSLGCVENCQNMASVNGRKEVGGIVGQTEPAMQLNFQEDYLQKMKRQINELSKTISRAIDHAADCGDENADSLYQISDDLKEAYKLLEKMMSEGFTINDNKIEHTDEYYEYRTSLSSSMSDVFDTLDSIATTSSDSSEALRNDLTQASNQLRDFGITTIDFADSLTNPKDMYQDVSNLDDDNFKEGKLISCVNNGFVSGDINVGGITGKIGKENNLDPEDEFSIVGKTSLNATYRVKAVISACTNYGKISLKRNNAGGICGSQDLGLIKNSINYGILDCEDGKYIGGIVGQSISDIKNNFAKCFIFGDEYVGGIAGSGIKLEDNGSLVQILSGNKNVGSILGNYGNISIELVEDSDSIKNNWYIYELSAIDGISYKDKAYKLSEDDFLAMDLNKDLKKVNIYFYDDDVLLSKYALDYGESLSLDDVPMAKDKAYDYAIWPNLEEDSLKDIKKDLLFVAEYNSVYPSISSLEEPLAHIVVEGKFFKDDSVVCLDSDAKPFESDYLTIQPQFNISELSKVDGIRLYANGYRNFDVYEHINNDWYKVDYEIDGSYVVITYNPDVKEISIVKTTNYLSYAKYLGAGTVVFVVGIILFAKKKKKGK